MINSAVATLPESNIIYRGLKLGAVVTGEVVKSNPGASATNALIEFAEHPVESVTSTWNSLPVAKAFEAAGNAESIPGKVGAFARTGFVEGFKSGVGTYFGTQADLMSVFLPWNAPETVAHTLTGSPAPSRQLRAAFVDATGLSGVSGKVDLTFTGTVKESGSSSTGET
jgi:hypothetical protein